MAVGSGDVLTYCKAMVPLDPTDLVDLYWAGRITLVSRRDDIRVYDEVFRRFFLARENPVQELLRLEAQAATEAEAAFEIPKHRPGRRGAGGDAARPGGVERRGPRAQVLRGLALWRSSRC
jgi:uncharacterized protein with von Willebrand factor type A (vWA) domain